MELSTLNVSKTQARAAVAEYRKAVGEHNRAEDRAVLRGYNAILRGRRLIELSKVIAAGGADENHRPRLAVFRADQPICFMRATSRGAVSFTVRQWPRIGERSRSLNLDFTDDTLPRWGSTWDTVTGTAIVPSIPPRLRPLDAIENYHILWEADWKAAPVDPALIKHLGGDLWAVLAVWDLTYLERAVLAGRRSFVS